MRVPSLKETIEHFKRAGYTLVDESVPATERRRWMLYHAHRGESGPFDSLLSVWVFWLRMAFPVLKQDYLMKRYLRVFRKASRLKKIRMAKDLEDYISGSEPTNELVVLLQADPSISVDNMPKGWKRSLEESFTTGFQGRPFIPYVVSAIRAIEPTIELRPRDFDLP